MRRCSMRVTDIVMAVRADCDNSEPKAVRETRLVVGLLGLPA